MRASASVLLLAACFDVSVALTTVQSQDSSARASSIMEEAMMLLSEEKKLAEHDQQMSKKFSQLRNEQAAPVKGLESSSLLQQNAGATAQERLEIMERIEHEKHLKELESMEQLEHLEHLEQLEHEEYLEHLQHLDAAKLLEEGVKAMSPQEKLELKASSDETAEKKAEETTEKKAEETQAPKGLARTKQYACTEQGKEVLNFYIEKPESHSKCMPSQLDHHCMPYEKFPAVKMPVCTEGDFMCMKKLVADHEDCVTHDIDWNKLEETHHHHHGDETGAMKMSRASVMMGEWCSHIRLIREVIRRVEMDPNFEKDYPTFLMLDHDVVLDPSWTEEVVKDFVNGYTGKWDMVQLDPLGKIYEKDIIGKYRERNIYKVSEKADYKGFHAVLVKSSSAKKLMKMLEGMNVVPIDGIHKKLNEMPSSEGFNALAWDAGIARNFKSEPAQHDKHELSAVPKVQLPVPDECRQQ